MANHLAMAALVEPGDEVLIEEPSYGAIVSTAEYLGAKIRRFPRKFESGFQLDPREVERSISARTRLIVITNLHNPSGVRSTDSKLRIVGEIARSMGAHVLVDEVYLEACFDSPWQTAYLLGPNFVTTSSLTKAYGLTGLRCGWIFAAKPLAERMWRLNDLFGVMAPHPIELLSVLAFEHLAEIAARAKQLLTTNRALLKEFLQEPPGFAGDLARSRGGRVPATHQRPRRRFLPAVTRQVRNQRCARPIFRNAGTFSHRRRRKDGGRARRPGAHRRGAG